MEIHRSIATSSKEPSIDMSLDIRSAFSAQTQKSVLNAIAGEINVPAQQSQAISKQGAFQPFKGCFKPYPVHFQIVFGRRFGLHVGIIALHLWFKKT